MTTSIGLGVAIHTPLSGVGESDVSFFGQATMLGHPFTIRGGNASGSWYISAQIDGTIDLHYTLDNLFGEANGSGFLPPGFPALTLSDLSFTFDVDSGDYDAHGQTSAADLTLGGTTFENASFALDLSSKQGGWQAALESRVKWQGVDAQLEVRLAPNATSIHLTANQFEFSIGRGKTEHGANLLALVRPGTGAGFHEVELAWAKSAWQTAPWDSRRVYAAGITVRALLVLGETSVGRLLQIDEPLRISVDTHELHVEIGNDEAKPKLRLPLRGATTAEEASDADNDASRKNDEGADAVEAATNAQLTITGPLSLGAIIDELEESTGGSISSSTWREYVGECLELENLGLSLITSPKLGIAVVLDARIQVGMWLGIAVRKAEFRFIPDKLPFTDVDVDASLQDAAIVVQVPPLVKASVALMYEHDDASTVRALTGSGQLQFFDKLTVGLLVHFEWSKSVFQGAFGFVFAKGFAVGTPAFQLTGIGGGFGYHRTLVLPTAAEAVATNPIVALLKNDPDGDAFSDPTRMLDHLHTFMESLESEPHSWCVALGITFRIVECVDCVALVQAEVHPPHFDLALLGLADFAIGVSSYLIGHAQLALLTRWNSSDDSLRILGSLTKMSWLLHPSCKLRGGFAICLWFGGAYAGDFLVALGGYSPLLPTKPHYPALSRLGFTWNVADTLQLSGDLYLAIDRQGMQFGGRAGLKFTSRILDVEAQFSFDVLTTWIPPFFQTKVRVSVHFELRAIVTTRLGLVVDANVYGPPFGAEFQLMIDIKAWKRTFTIRAGSTLAAAKKSATPSRGDVLKFAKGGQTNALQIQITGHLYGGPRPTGPTYVEAFSNTEADPMQRFRGDDLQLTVTTTIPIKTVYRQRATLEMRHPYVGDRLDVRALGWSDVISDLIWDIRGPTESADWVCIPEMTRPVEALWYLPPNNAENWQASGRKAITSLRLGAPVGRHGEAGLGSVPVNRLQDADIEVALAVQSPPGQTSAPRPATKTDVSAQNYAEKRANFGHKLQALGLDLEGCNATTAFRALEARPLQMTRTPMVRGSAS
ncbi:MAG TPA: hypothetical protein PK156_27270 [Polyangium sp.]|nr:hypothetical protein [Polyangium sp.]